MKYIKTYENLKEDVKIGDYVLCSEYKDPGYKDILDVNDIETFIENNIGKIIELDRGSFDYIVKYTNIPKELKLEFSFLNNSARGMYKEEIDYVSKNKKDLESILLSKKYNI